jgi:hypothetical protein
MTVMLNTLILLFGTASYAAAVWQMLRGKYQPNTFSRVIWLLLAINSTAGVILSQSSAASILLAWVFLVGNSAMCVISFWYGTRRFGYLEMVCITLLLVSTLLWMTASNPLLNLGIGLFAHFVGAAPTFKSVYQNSKSESFAFWSLFFLASVFSLAASIGSPINSVIFPLYFVVFDGTMMGLCLRKQR